MGFVVEGRPISAIKLGGTPEIDKQTPMQRKIHEQNSRESRKGSGSRKSKRGQVKSGRKPKVSLGGLSSALYADGLRDRAGKVVLYDEFEGEHDAEGAVTERYEEVEKDNGDALQRCRKVADLGSKESTGRMREGRGKRRESRRDCALRGLRQLSNFSEVGVASS